MSCAKSMVQTPVRHRPWPAHQFRVCRQDFARRAVEYENIWPAFWNVDPQFVGVGYTAIKFHFASAIHKQSVALTADKKRRAYVRPIPSTPRVCNPTFHLSRPRMFNASNRSPNPHNASPPASSRVKTLPLVFTIAVDIPFVSASGNACAGEPETSRATWCSGKTRSSPAKKCKYVMRDGLASTSFHFHHGMFSLSVSPRFGSAIQWSPSMTNW